MLIYIFSDDSRKIWQEFTYLQQQPYKVCVKSISERLLDIQHWQHNFLIERNLWINHEIFWQWSLWIIAYQTNNVIKSVGISGKLYQKLLGSIKNLHVKDPYTAQGDKGHKTCWASHKNWEVEIQSFCRSFAVGWKSKGSPFVVLPLYSQEDPDFKTTTYVFLLWGTSKKIRSKKEV